MPSRRNGGAKVELHEWSLSEKKIDEVNIYVLYVPL
jgi:hypothetical protein